MVDRKEEWGQGIGRGDGDYAGGDVYRIGGRLCEGRVFEHRKLITSLLSTTYLFSCLSAPPAPPLDHLPTCPPNPLSRIGLAFLQYISRRLEGSTTRIILTREPLGYLGAIDRCHRSMHHSGSASMCFIWQYRDPSRSPELQITP